MINDKEKSEDQYCSGSDLPLRPSSSHLTWPSMEVGLATCMLPYGSILDFSSGAVPRSYSRSNSSCLLSGRQQANKQLAFQVAFATNSYSLYTMFTCSLQCTRYIWTMQTIGEGNAYIYCFQSTLVHMVLGSCNRFPLSCTAYKSSAPIWYSNCYLFIYFNFNFAVFFLSWNCIKPTVNKQYWDW